MNTGEQQYVEAIQALIVDKSVLATGKLIGIRDELRAIGGLRDETQQASLAAINIELLNRGVRL